jgi:type III secretion protein J
VLMLLGFFLVGCQEQILHDLSEQDANKVVSRLSASAVGAAKVVQSDGRWSIAVPRDQIITALAFLDTHRVLAPRAVSGNTVGRSGLVPSREEQWFRYERSMALAIEESLGALLGVLDARVHLNLPESDPLFGTRRDDVGSGSVLLVVDQRYSAKDDEIAALVAGAAGIPAAKVTVLHSVAQSPTVVQPAEPLVELPTRIEAPAGHQAPLPHEIGETEIALGCIGGIAAVITGGFLVSRRKRRVRFHLPAGVVSEE